MRGLVGCLRWRRCFSSSSVFREIRDATDLPRRIQPKYQEGRGHDVLALQWPSPPRNILVTLKPKSPTVTQSLVEYVNHVKSTYPSTSIILEPPVARKTHETFNFPIYTIRGNTDADLEHLHHKIDLVTTLGGDGTILRAASLFANSTTVPPILSFSMGSLGFLGEWKFKEYKRAFRDVYMSGAKAEESKPANAQETKQKKEFDAGQQSVVGLNSSEGEFMGNSRAARVIVRNRLKVGLFAPDGQRVTNNGISASKSDVHAVNEVIIHRGQAPHLAVVEVFVGGHFLTEAVADGMIISTPTGSTAYSLSSGGSIVHPLVSSLLLTPICPRSLSFRPLVLPANTPITLRLSEKNRSREVEVSVDGIRRSQGLSVGMELRVSGEEFHDEEGNWVGGVPSVVRGTATTDGADDSWVEGLNGLLKFNYPFGED